MYSRPKKSIRIRCFFQANPYFVGYIQILEKCSAYVIFNAVIDYEKYN